MEETVGQEGSGVYFFRNLYNRAGETQPKDLTGGKKPVVVEEKKEVERADVLSSMATVMASKKNVEARRRLSHSARVSMPVMVEA